MSKKQLNFILGLLASSLLTDARAEDVARNAIRTVHRAPPEAPPAATNPSPPRSAQGVFLSATPTLYSIGDPIDEEQLYLEYINRARSNPPLEGQRLINTTDPDVVDAYNVLQIDLLLVGSQFAAIGTAPPLSMNEKLLAAARLHTQDMFENQFQEHDGTNGCPVGKVSCGPLDRMTAQGYMWTFASENVFASAKSVFYGHAGLNVDWGGTSGNGGIQNPPGHRNSIQLRRLQQESGDRRGLRLCARGGRTRRRRGRPAQCKRNRLQRRGRPYRDEGGSRMDRNPGRLGPAEFPEGLRPC